MKLSILNQRKKLMLNTLRHFWTLKEQFFGKVTSKLKGVKTLKSVPSDYTCQYCKVTKPLTEEYFQKVKNFKYGFSTICNECNRPKNSK
jgi:hypothetical protein